jgi:lysyl-tRNA synthetase class 2
MKFLGYNPTMEINTYEQDRIAKIDKIKALGFSPYGEQLVGFASFYNNNDRLSLKCKIADQDAKLAGVEHPNSATGPEAAGQGRIVLRRVMGNLHFLTVRDESGDMQVALNKKLLSESEWRLAQLFDLADIIQFEGRLALTKTGEHTLWAYRIKMSAKALSTPPAKVEGLQDIEQRYRKRYVDLWSNPVVLKVMQARSHIIKTIRNTLDIHGFMEVEAVATNPPKL